MADFILEIGIEEMPARFVPRLGIDLKDIFSNLLKDSMIDCASVETFATPRRLTVFVKDMAAMQRKIEEEVSGPPARIAYDADGNPTKALQGFAKSQGIALEDIYTLETDKGDYLAAKKTVGGGETTSILPELCVTAIKKLSFPKKMKWGNLDFTFGRPLRWILCLFGENVVEFGMAGLSSGRQTFGHRVMGPGPFDVSSAADYFAIVKDKCSIIISPDQRAESVRSEGDKLAADLSGSVVWKDSLLQEVSNLVELPMPIIGNFEESFLELPKEVLLTSMESHQKCFGLQNDNGDLLPHFLCTLNLIPKDVELVRKGWEKVLKARLEDGRFFWKKDLETEFNVWLEKLENVVFLGPLGSMGDKSRRMERLAALIAGKVDASLQTEMARAGRLAKADLVSEMVNEFDKLQGKMGGIYAAKRGEDDVVCKALAEQYLPAGPESPVPSTLGGAILSMTDKADTLVGCFGLNKIPTGANDTYALRRAALGIVRMIIEFGLRVDILEIMEMAFDGYSNEIKWKLEKSEVLEKLGDFISSRLRAYFTGQGYETRVVDAALGAGFRDVTALKARVEALAEFAKADGFEQSVLTFKRAANIIKKQGNEEGVVLTGGFEVDRLVEQQEKDLAVKLDETAARFEELWENDEFTKLFAILGELRPFVDDFFDNVMVICEDKGLRMNRLNLLQALVDRLSRLADFGALQV
ncbi:glycine--tRNA ligase subunit beta [Maridesulfovibrio hydrothermalis]|uniref:Glycine--tRNA ligase beta subunit n=1 Tax=Maridesulfovibrio hydrothermalis AM13 = DSM 14728 TaxID=1121451 RepID=L0RG56_9BACT|nr:glycine--tRNA ligase subunit beta [Maridesulfovibrio hydrothermalis]CCO24541.1 Glycine--tRNA ligase beta subunit [Maridesulfovibrio hydrothermalis AM13 = DSM 14728]